jgi:CRP/FNR family cyclic AMP-dependent transcriptional regulator
MSIRRSDPSESFRDGELIVREGEESREMFVIQQGRVEVSKVVDGQEVVLAVLERGSFFGEMSLLESLPRNASVRAKGNARLVVIEPGSLLMKIRRDPTFAFEMLQHMSRRIRDLDERLVAMLSGSQSLQPDESPESVSASIEYAAHPALASRAREPAP